ncbi:ROK family protein [Streptomyces sp. NPDC092296]|uniref:ROK family protein n=1 Tax=Streptomyces sp. NPDC092296 TaxID=3366012 RepID=UPI0038179F84
MQTDRTGTEAAPRGAAGAAVTGDGVALGTGDLVAALDIGGTKIAGALVDLDGAILARSRRPTPAQEPGESVMRAVTEVLDELSAAPGWERVRGIGIGSAGPVDAVLGTVSPVNIAGWRDFPLVERVRRHPSCGGLPVLLIGDGVAITAAEHWQGAARGHDNALCMVVSTGVGGGLVLGGTLHPGPTGNAGHIGHISVELDGELCPCGCRGCVELIASGTSIARRALRDGWRPTGGDSSAAAVAAAARAGDPVALASYDRAAQALAAAIAATATLVEIDVAVVGGGVAQAGEVLFGPLRERLAQYATLPFVRGLEVRPAQLGTDGGLVGAAAAAIEGLGLGAGARG